jgi:hypothetical protein
MVYGGVAISPSALVGLFYGNRHEAYPLFSSPQNFECSAYRVSQMRDQGMLYLYHFTYLTFDTASAPVRIAKEWFDFIMTPDFDKYRHYVDGFDLSETQKRELVQIVWSIMESFVDQAWGLHPVQQCGGILKDKDLQGSPGILESKNSKTSNEFRYAVTSQGTGDKDSEG